MKRFLPLLLVAFATVACYSFFDESRAQPAPQHGLLAIGNDVGSGSGSSSAGPAASPTTDSELIRLMTNGEYVPALGVLLVIVVGGLRASLGAKVKWFKTQAGGYTLAYGTSILLYVGAALQQYQPINAHLILMAAIVALTASGILEHLRDITGANKSPPDPVTLAVATGSAR
jgi:hypothetical protein